MARLRTTMQDVPPPTSSEPRAPEPATGAPDQPAAGRLRAATGALLALGAALWASRFAVNDRDLPLHLALGRDIASRGGLSDQDPFSYTTGDRLFANFEWGFDLAAFMVFDAFGIPGILVARMALVATLVVLLLTLARRLSDRRDGWPALAVAALLLVVVPLARPRLIERPHLVGLTFLFAHLWMARHLADATRARARLAWAAGLALSMPFWVAAHGSWPLAFVVTGAHVLASPGRRRAFIGTGLAQLALLPVGPYGFSVLLVPFQHLGDPRVRVFFTEFQSPLVHLDPTAIGLCVGLGLLAAALALSRRHRRDLPELLVAAAFTVLAARSYRFVAPWLLLLVPPAAARLADAFRAAPPRRGLALAGLALLAGSAVYVTRFDVQPDPMEPGLHWEVRHLPRAAAKLVLDHDLPGPVFNDMDVGDDLTWTLGQHRKIVIDGRYYLYADGLFDAYLAMLDDPTRFDVHVQTYEVKLALLAFTEARNARLVRHLQGSEAWGLVHLDASFALWARDDALIRARAAGLELRRVQPAQSPEELLVGPADAALAAEIARVDAASHAPFGDVLGVVFHWRRYTQTRAPDALSAVVTHAGAVVEEAPRLLFARLRRGQALLALGRAAEAVQDLSIVARVTGSPEAVDALQRAQAALDAAPGGR